MATKTKKVTKKAAKKGNKPSAAKKSKFKFVKCINGGN